MYCTLSIAFAFDNSDMMSRMGDDESEKEMLTRHSANQRLISRASSTHLRLRARADWLVLWVPLGVSGSGLLVGIEVLRGGVWCQSGLSLGGSLQVGF